MRLADGVLNQSAQASLVEDNCLVQQFPAASPDSPTFSLTHSKAQEYMSRARALLAVPYTVAVPDTSSAAGQDPDTGIEFVAASVPSGRLIDGQETERKCGRCAWNAALLA